jgi:DNA-binding NarL/FixJ family response regulator
MSIAVFVVDPHPVAKAGIAQFMAGTEIHLVGEASAQAEAMQWLEEHEADVVILCGWTPALDGFQTLAEIKYTRPRLNVLLMACDAHTAHIAQAYRLGAAGFLLRSASPDRLVEAVRMVASGEKLWVREDLRRITGVLTFAQTQSDFEVPLTPRELDVLQQLAQGKTNRTIGQDLGISYETVKEHVQHLLRKIGVDDRTQAAVWAVRKSLV